MKVETDSAGNAYVDVENIRVTAVPKTWSGDAGIRIQAYKGDGGLHRGAELPIPDKSTAYDFLRAIQRALEENGL